MFKNYRLALHNKAPATVEGHEVTQNKYTSTTITSAPHINPYSFS